MTPRARALPRVIDAPGGPVRVTLRRGALHDDDGNEAWGLYDVAKRRIYISRAIPPAHRWKVLWHEWTHVALIDAGLDNGIEERLHEAICDAIATARVREVLR